MTETLLPCPFCCDPMEDRGYGAVHIDGNGCAINGLAIDPEKWNRRAPSPSSNLVTDEMIAKARLEYWNNHSDPQVAMRSALEAALAVAPAPLPNVTGVDIPRLPVGTTVEKVGGYPFPGTVVAAFHTLSGQERFVVEATGDVYAGMLHIFNGGQLRATTEGQSDGN